MAEGTRGPGVVVLLLLWCGGCVSLSPTPPRFVQVFDQRTLRCRIQVIQDVRSAACFVAFQCGRQPLVVLSVEPAVCVP